MGSGVKNIDHDVVEAFGDEWSRFKQDQLTNDDLNEMFESYFHIFPWDKLPPNSTGFDMGCGSGRWAKLVAGRVGTLHCIDPSNALNVAKENLSDQGNCKFHRASVEEQCLPQESCDFGYSLGVLHHIPDTMDGLESCRKLLKPGAPFLVYLYYKFDNKPFWYRWLWSISELGRAIISKLPYGARYSVSQIIALLVYWPLARIAKMRGSFGAPVENWPLSYYRHRSFYVMRTDALDRFGTRLEKRFTKKDIEKMLLEAGFENIKFSARQPFWVAISYRSH